MANTSHHLRLGKPSVPGSPFKRRHAHNYYVMGRQRAEEGAWDDARTLLLRALDFDPDLAPALHTIASLELSLNHCALARDYAERAIALDPGDPDGHTLLGNIALTEQHPSVALEAYLHALHCGGDTTDLHFNTGLAHMFLNQAEPAAQRFRRLVEEDPSHQRAWDALGCALRMLKDYAGAADAFMRALQLDPNSCDSRDHLAQVLLDTGNPKRAVQMLESVLEVEPERATTRHLLGMACAALQDYQRAIDCWRSLIARQSASVDTYHLLANAYLHLDKIVCARETLQTLVALYPQHVSGRLQLALLLLEEGEHREGLRHLEHARALDPHNPMIAHALVTAQAYSLTNS